MARTGRGLSTGVRRLLSVAVVVVVVVVGVIAYESGGDDAPDRAGTSDPGTSYAGQKQALDPHPDLAAMKSAAGIRDCAAGPGGGDLPDVTLDCLGGGRSVDLDSLRGPMVLSFWASWCGPCREEMPALQAFDQAHGAQVPVLGIDFQDAYPASALQKMRSRGVTYPSLTDPDGTLAQQSVFADILHLPVLVFLDAQGHIAYQKIGGVDSADEVSSLVREHLGVDL